MKTLIINLDSQTDKMVFQQQLLSLDIEFQRLPAYIINNEENETYLQYYNSWQRPLNTTEVSCFF